VSSYVNTSLVPQTNVILSTNWEFSQKIHTIKSLYKWTHHWLFLTQACLILITFSASCSHGETYCRYSIWTVHVTVMVLDPYTNLIWYINLCTYSYIDCMNSNTINVTANRAIIHLPWYQKRKEHFIKWIGFGVPLRRVLTVFWDVMPCNLT
jgi:hypothetical protein